MGKSKIEWCDRVWNPVTGCTKISPGCQNCYAERMSKRFGEKWGLPKDNPFKVTLHPDRLDQPLHWTKPSKIFVCSMSDLFHDDVPDSFLDQVFAYMAKAEQHTFLVLTKRPERMRNYIFKAMYDEDCNYDGWYEALNELGIPDAAPMENVWLGVTAEDQEQADKRIPILLQTPAAKRFVSVEPMLSAVDLNRYIMPSQKAKGTLFGAPIELSGKDLADLVGLHSLDWVICGGESGPGARPVHPDWVRSLREQCKMSKTAFLFKQWGEWAPMPCIDSAVKSSPVYEFSNQCMCRVGKKKAGRLLDGQLWDQYPENES
ncbi:MAG: phage Gp37/Gp68 family protein [Veillonellales bacterium]